MPSDGHSDALRRAQTQSDAIRGLIRHNQTQYNQRAHQTQSDAIRGLIRHNQTQSEGSSEGFEPLHARTCESVASPSTLSFMKGMRAHAAAAGP